MATMKEIQIRPTINGAVNIPGSKSVSHRALIAAGLAEGSSLLKELLICEDTLYTVNALRQLGIQIILRGNNAEVLGMEGKFPVSDRRSEIFMGNSGTSFRLLLSTVALSRGDYILSGSPRMNERPIGALTTVLSRMGVKLACLEKKGYPPVRIQAQGIPGGKVVIAGDQSSQFVSSLLLAGPYAEKDMEIEVDGQLVSRPYVDITLDVMEHFGVYVVRSDYHYIRVPCRQTYRSCRFTIEGDVSSASYFWAAAAVTGGTVTTTNIHPKTTRQGDLRFLEILAQMGCHVESGRAHVTVGGGSLCGIDADMSTMPDMVPTLAAIALFANGKTVIRNVPHLRYKESDRLAAVASEWRRLGSRIEELPDGLIIYGNHKLHGTTLESHDDHRLAMALAVVGLKVPGVKIKNEGCVNKSFPQFWNLWDTLH